MGQRKLKENAVKKEMDVEDEIILTYFNQYEIYETINYIFKDFFFGVQLPNPLPSICLVFEQKAIHFFIDDLSSETVKVFN